MNDSAGSAVIRLCKVISTNKAQFMATGKQQIKRAMGVEFLRKDERNRNAAATFTGVVEPA